MLTIENERGFLKKIARIKNKGIKSKVKKHIAKIIDNPFIGKPMRYSRKGTRELYIHPYRISYTYIKNSIVFLDLYHKDEQ